MKTFGSVRTTSALLAISVAVGFGGLASAADALKSPGECELHRQLSNSVPAECATGIKYRSLVPVGPGAAPPAAPAVAETVSTGRKSANLTVGFEYNSATLTPGARADLDRLASVLLHGVNTGSRFNVVGHTDAAGGEEYNLRLSSQRASAVESYLRSRGVDASRLYSEGKGKADLLDPSRPTSAANRRVEIVNLGR